MSFNFENCCNQWLTNYGNFGKEGYEFDHIIDLQNGGNNEITNYQALCPGCHNYKTKRTPRNNKKKYKRKKLTEKNQKIILGNQDHKCANIPSFIIKQKIRIKNNCDLIIGSIILTAGSLYIGNYLYKYDSQKLIDKIENLDKCENEEN